MENQNNPSPLKNFFNSIMSALTGVILFFITFFSLLYVNNLSNKIYNIVEKKQINKKVETQKPLTIKYIKITLKTVIFLFMWSALNLFVKPLISLFEFIPLVGYLIERLTGTILGIINFFITLLVFFFVRLIT